MKEFLFQAGLFIVFTAAISSFTGCNDSGDTEREKVVNNAVNIAVENAKNGGEPPKSSSDYPPIASAVANADIQNLDGTSFKVADKKGKVLLLNMWATWCGPCRAEMPALVRMQEKHRDAGLEVIGLNTDDEPVDAINAFAKEMNLNYTLTWADTGLQQSLLKISKFGGIPQSFLVDRDGNLRGVFRGVNPADIKVMEDLVAKVVAGEEGSVAPPAANSDAPSVPLTSGDPAAAESESKK